MNFVQNILWNSVEGFVEAGTRTAGGYAGDALIKAGDLIENSGRNVGSGLERTASGYGSKLSGQAYTPSGKALPSTARKPAMKRSVSSPASSKAKATGPTSKTPMGANKHPGGKGLPGTATKQITSGVSGAKSTTGSAQKTVGASVGAAKKSLPKAVPNNVPYGTSTTPSAAKSKATSGITAGKGVAESKLNSLPKPYGSSPFPSTEKKTAMKPNQGKTSKVEGKTATGGVDEKTPYPGTNTYPGQGPKTPVRPQKYKPMERLKPQVEKGKMQHITV